MALGYVRREWSESGTALDAVLPPEGSEGGASVIDEAAPPPCRVEVCSLPFL